MTGVWVTGSPRNSKVGYKQGFACKYYGHDWNPGTEIIPTSPSEVMENMERHVIGQYLTREEMPEAGFVYNEQHFSSLPDFFFVNGFNAVKGKWADVLSSVNLGEKGGLVPFPIYLGDKKTLVEQEHFLVNFDNASKDSLISGESEALRELLTLERDGIELWSCSAGVEDGGLALNVSALSGPDWWFEKRLHSKMFMSEQLVQAIKSTGAMFPWNMKKCTIVASGV